MRLKAIKGGRESFCGGILEQRYTKEWGGTRDRHWNRVCKKTPDPFHPSYSIGFCELE